MKKINNSNTFYCFSPPVMIATFLIELILTIWVIYRYRKSEKMYVIISLLICLALFQAAEYYVCTGSSQQINASKLGYVAITFLPVLGFYLMSLLTVINRTLIKVLLVIALSFSLYFIFAPNVFDGYVCTGNYVIFQIGDTETLLYSTYYFGLILVSMMKGILYIKDNKRSENKSAIKWFLAGYIFFILPTSIMILFNPDSSKALPSVLCGFAISMAITLAVKVAPLILKKNKKI
jgi:hypothetical protein